MIVYYYSLLLWGIKIENMLQIEMNKKHSDNIKLVLSYVLFGMLCFSIVNKQYFQSTILKHHE